MAKEQTTAASGTAAQSDADFLDGISGQGYEGIGKEDRAIPFLKILQSNNPEVNEGDPSTYVQGAKPGVFFNTVTKRIYGAEINLIPLKYERVWLCWAPNRGGLRNRVAPNSIHTVGDPFSEEGMQDDEGNDVSDTMTFYCLVADYIDEGVIVFSLNSSGLRHGKDWNEMIDLNRTPNGKKAAFFGSVWNLKLVSNKNDKGTWYQFGTKSTNASKVRDITKDEFVTSINPGLLLLEAGTAKADYAQLGGPEQGAAGADIGKTKDIPF